MKESHRTLRMARHHKRNKKVATLNMVSMMDIFTILVFFLLVSATEQESLPSLKHIKLPESLSEQKPKENIVIMVNKDSITFQGKEIVSSQKVMSTNSAVIPELIAALNAETKDRTSKRVDEKEVKKRGVTIMGDKEIPYALLKKIMLTCAGTDFTNISLAIVQKKPEQS